MASRCFYILAVVAMCLAACKKDSALDCFKRSGATQTEVRYMEPFTVVNVADKMDVEIRQGPDYKVEVTAGEHLLKSISTTVSGHTLNITNNNTCNFVRGYKKTIHISVVLPVLTYVRNEGVGTVYVNDLQQDTLVARTESSGDIHIGGTFKQIRTSAHGNGDMYINGGTNSFFIYTKGTNYVHAENLAVRDYLFVQTLTLGDCYINCQNLQELAYNIGSTGNIYYTGNPTVVNDVSDGLAKGKAIRE